MTGTPLFRSHLTEDQTAQIGRHVAGGTRPPDRVSRAGKRKVRRPAFKALVALAANQG